VQMLESAKRKIVFFWLTHGFLRRIAKRYPEYFTSWVDDITDNRIAKKIMKLRYIDNLKFEAISYEMNTDIRNVFSYHKKVIESIIAGE
jgi:hypothetical protein